jgi:hypothetical protein
MRWQDVGKAAGVCRYQSGRKSANRRHEAGSTSDQGVVRRQWAGDRESMGQGARVPRPGTSLRAMDRRNHLNIWYLRR